MTRHSITLGKIDYNGKANCEVTLEWELTEAGRFSMTGSIWNPRKTDIYSGGQNIAEAVSYFPENATAQRMKAVWERWHLNDMRAGTPAQEAWLEAHKAEFPGYPATHYDWAIAGLTAAGLNPDNGYSYGSKWLKEELPADIIAEIRSWEE